MMEENTAGTGPPEPPEAQRSFTTDLITNLAAAGTVEAIKFGVGVVRDRLSGTGDGSQGGDGESNDSGN